MQPTKPLLLNDLLHLNQTDINRAKIKFNQDNHYNNPIDLYLRNPEEINTRWLFWRYEKRREFKVGHLAICLLRLSWNTWLLTTIKNVTRELGITNGINCEGEEIAEYQPYYGRVIVRYQKTHQSQYVMFGNVINKMVVEQILPSVYDGVDFPGYDNVKLSYEELATIVRNRKKDWIAALENQKAVYLIVDESDGRQYVGAAYGDNGMLLQRWTNYVNNGHGGNKLLKEIVNEKGFDHIKKNFSYAILENYNARVDKHIILQRESWWKNTLGSRAFGLNGN